LRRAVKRQERHGCRCSCCARTRLMRKVAGSITLEPCQLLD
jgi:hypothetical protein